MKTFKMLPRLFAAFGMVMMFAVSGWGESPDIGGTCATATTVNASSTTSSLAINPNDDMDYFKIVLTQSGTLTVSSSSANGDVVGRLYDSSCSQLYSDTGNSNFSISQPLSAGTYYVSVEDKGKNSNRTYNFVSAFVVPLPTLSISPTTLSTTEGDSGTTNASYTVTLSSASTSTVTVNYSTTDGTATAGSDFTTTSGSLSFAPSETTKTITVPIIGDTTGEPSETYTLTLSSPTNATISTATATGTITNDDPPSLSIGDVSISEGNSGTKTLTFTVALSSSPSSAVEFDWATANGTATAASDYTAASGHIRFNPNTSTLQQILSVTIRGDTTLESDETFYVNLTNVTGISLFDSQAMGTITDDDTSYAGDNVRPFTQAFSTNKKGNIKIIGNSSSCKSSGGVCVEPTTSEYNQDITTQFYKLAGDPASVVNSSSSVLTLPTGRSILWAGLYWQGSYYSGSSDTPASSTAAQMKTVKLKAPGMSAYSTITTQASKFNWAHNTLFYYQGMQDITSIVRTYGDGTYSVADINATTGSAVFPGGNIAAWSIVVVYDDNTTTLKNLTVFDGFGTVPSDVTATLSGFLTPSNPTIDGTLALFAGEGDRSPTGDSLNLTKKDGTSCSLGANVLNSSIADTSGTNVTTRTPAYVNTIGIDIDTYNIGSSGTSPKNCISGGQTSTTITFGSSNDIYQPGMVATAIEIYAPNLEITKTPSTSSGSTLTAGTQIDYSASFKNTGKEAAKEIVIFDDFTQNLLTLADGTSTNPSVYLSDLLERNATKILQSIRLSDVNSTATWNCPSGTSGLSGCSGGYDANCSVDYTGDSSTTATTVWCYVPKVDINATYTMKFSVNIAANPDTQGQDVLVENQMFASYKDNLTGVSMPNAASNVANAGAYGGGISISAVGFDARETSITQADNNRSITTKIANKPFQVKVVSLNTSNSIAAYQGLNNTRVYLHVVDTAQCLPNTDLLNLTKTLPKTNYVEFDEGNITQTSLNFNEANAGKDKKIALNYINWSAAFQQANFKCSNSNTDAVLKGVPQCLNADQKIEDVFGIAVRNACAGGAAHGMNPAVANPACQSNSYNAGNVPDYPYDNTYGCYQCISGLAGTATCSTDNFAIRPEKLEIVSTHYDWSNILRSGEDYNTTIHAYSYNSTTNTPDYNVTDANSTYVLTTIKYMKNNEINATMAGTAAFAAGGFDMQNGVSAKSGVIGEIAGLSFSDVGKININIQDQNWSAVDNDDTPMNCDANGTYVCGDKNVTFIPDHFNFSALGITNNNGNPGSFTYIANEVDQMAGRIHTQIQALNKLNAVTANFASFPLWENNVTVVPVVTKATYLYPDANETNISNMAVRFSFGAKTIAWDEDNASQYLRFNFRRDINLPQNPFDVNGSNLNISMTSHYVDVDSGNVADINGSRLSSGTNALPYSVVSPADGNSTFVYGRIIPRDVRIFGTVPFTANAWYEVFNTPTIAGTLLTGSRNESSWFINGLHDDTADGDGTVTFVNSGAANIGGTAAGGIETYGFPAQTPPYSAKAHINTEPWLWYGVSVLPYSDPSAVNLECMTHPCFNINVAPAVGATGSAKSGAEDKKASKSSTSEGTGWHSTTDYAPAIR